VQPWRSILSAYGLEFLAGAMLACVRTHLRWHPAWLPVLLGTAGLGFSVGSFSDWFDKVELLRAGSFGLIGVSMVILGWLLPLEAPGPHSKTARVLLRIGVEVGNASFALYLLHPMLIELGLFAAKRWGWITAENHLFLFFLFPTCVLLAWIWYRYFERPLYDSAVKFFISRPRSDDRYIVTTTKTQ
jgi:peptidoglycan/LPS O-acetylase OafA/YrhL